jgi:3D (Asp-Asp-Asp) domain-containing protein
MDFLEKILNFFSNIFPTRHITHSQESRDLLDKGRENVIVGHASDATAAVAEKKPADSELRPWRLTQYYVASQKEHGGTQNVPVFRSDGQLLGYASPGFFSSLSLEGTGVMGNGKLINVTGVYIPVDQKQYQSVWDYHKKYLSKRAPGYSGLVVENDRVVKAFAFREITQNEIGVGYGYDNGIPRDPFRTLAADLGRTKRSDPKWKGKGGLVPVGTRVYIRELDGVKIPDRTVHDGWCVVNDTGGGIFGAHFDVFVGYSTDGKKVKLPHLGHIWFEGIDEKAPEGYDYGLKDE